MAKRRRLNKRVAVLLGAMGIVLVALVLTLAIRGCGGSQSLLDRLFPKDPVALLKQARAAQGQKRYDVSSKLYVEAIEAARAAGEPNVHEYYYHGARFSHEWAVSRAPGLTKTQRGELFRGAVRRLHKALNRKPDYVKARQYLCSMFWDISRASRGQGWPDFIREADALLKLQPEDHVTWFRRGLAKAAMSHSMEGQTAKDGIADMEKAIELKADETTYWLGLIRFLRRLETRDAQVEQTFRKAIEAVADDPGLLIDYAAYLREAGQSDEAQQFLDQAIRLDPVRGNIALADHFVATGKLADALSILQHVTQINEQDPRAYLRQAHVFARQGKSPEAIAVLKRGLGVIERVVATQPAGQRRIHERSGIELNYLLANVLLDMVEQGHSDADKLLAEAREALRKMTVLQLRAPLRAKVSGRIALAEGKTVEAIEQLETAYRTLPTFDTRTANLLINVYLKQNLPGKADAILNDLLRMPGQQRNASVLLAKARLLIRYRDYDQADRLITRVLQLDPKNADALNLKMVILAVRGETPTLPPGMKPSSQTVGMLLDRAAVIWLDGRQQEAVKYVEKLRQRAPRSRIVIRRLFSMYRALSRLDDAEKLLDEAIKAFPDDKILKTQRQVVRENDPQKQYEILIKAADGYPPLQRAVEKANIAALAGRRKEHLQYLLEAAKIDPNAPGVVDRLFRYGLQEGDWKLAEECVDRATKANLDGSRGMLFRTHLAVRRGDHDGAIASALEVLKDQPNRKDARVLLGQAYLSKKDYEQAYEAFRIVSNNDPAYAPALIGLAAVTQAQGKLAEHKGYVNAAYRLAPRDRYIRKRYFEIESENAKPAELITQRERALKRDPDDLRNIAGLGALYEIANRLKEAENMYVTLHQKSPDKLYSARVLCSFYRRMNRVADIERILDPLLATAKDGVAVRILYGEMLMSTDAEKARSFLENAVTVNVEDPRAHLALARYWALRRNWRKAVESMRNYVRRRPEDLGGTKELIRYSIDAGEFQAAEQRLDEVLRNDPTDGTALTLKAVLALRQGHVKKAERLFGQAIRDNPTYAEPLIYRAQLYLAQGEPNKAKADLQAAKRLSNRVDVAMQLGTVYSALRDYDNAELIFREIRAEQKNYTPAIDQLIGIYSRRQKWRELEELLAELRTIFPRHAGYYMAEAGMWNTRERQDKKLAALAKAVELAPRAMRPLRAYLMALQEAGQHDNVLAVSQSYFEKPGFGQWVAAVRATSLAKLGRKDEADALFLKSLETIQADFILMVVLQLREAYGLDGAAAKIDKWIAQRSRNWRLHLMLGVLYAEDAKLAKSVPSLVSARDLADQPLATFLAERQLGATFYQMRKFPEAEQAYLGALKIRQGDVQVLNNLAYLYTNDVKDPAKGLPFAERAARQLPNNAKVLDTLGWTLANMGRYSDAEQALVRAVQLEKPLAASRFHLGWVYEKIGRLEEALKQYRQGFEMIRARTDDRLHEPLKEALERVRRRLEELGRSPKPGSAK